MSISADPVGVIEVLDEVRTTLALTKPVRVGELTAALEGLLIAYAWRGS